MTVSNMNARTMIATTAMLVAICLAPSVSSTFGQSKKPVLESASRRTTYKLAPTSELSTTTFSDDNDAVHPLEPLLQLARALCQDIHNEIHDYTCVLIKRERIDGELRPYEYVDIKFRGHRRDDGSNIPFSVYAKVIAPKSIRGRQVLFVEGQHGEDVLVTKGGRRNHGMTFSIRPEGRMAMRDNKYPITAFGMENLLARVMVVAQDDLQHGECQVRTVAGTKVDDRGCTMYEVTHPVARDHFLFHVARIFVDDEFHVPVRFAAYTWPELKGGEPELVEEYTFRNLQFNVGLTDADFAYDNPQYNFHLSEDE